MGNEDKENEKWLTSDTSESPMNRVPGEPRPYVKSHINYFEYYTIYAIIILKNGVKCEVRKWKLD